MGAWLPFIAGNDMKQDFFKEQMGRCKAMHPQSRKWNSDVEAEYWQALRGLPEDDFKVAVSRCLREVSFFPALAELWSRLPDRREDKGDHEIAESCDRSDDGFMVLLTASGNQSVAACSCPRGDQRRSVRDGGRKIRYYDEIFRQRAEDQNA